MDFNLLLWMCRKKKQFGPAWNEILDLHDLWYHCFKATAWKLIRSRNKYLYQIFAIGKWLRWLCLELRGDLQFGALIGSKTSGISGCCCPSRRGTGSSWRSWRSSAGAAAAPRTPWRVGTGNAVSNSETRGGKNKQKPAPNKWTGARWLSRLRSVETLGCSATRGQNAFWKRGAEFW